MCPTQKVAIALIAGATIHAVGGSVGQVVQASTLVSDDMFSYPLTSAELVAVSLAEAVAFGLGLVGLAALRASGVVGPNTRGAHRPRRRPRRQRPLRLCGARVNRRPRPALGRGGRWSARRCLRARHPPARRRLTAAGVAARRARLWEGWRPTALLAGGLWTLALLGIVMTPLMPLGIAVMGLLQIAVGAGLLTRPTPVGTAVRPAGATPSIALR